MKIGWMDVKWTPVPVLICALFCAAAFAQSQPPGSLDSLLTIEDPNARIAALQKFLKTNNVPEQTQAAREATVASWAQLADAQLGENNIEKAGEHFRRALAALPEKVTDRFFDETVIRVPLAVSVRGYRNEAIELARQLEKRFAREAPRLASLGEFYMTIEATADALRALETASKLAEEDPRLHRLLGAAYRMGLRLDDAIAEYQLAIKFDPGDKRAYYELANLYRAHGAYADAIKLYRKQLEIEPKHTPSHKGLALAHLAQGNEEEMTAALNRARDLRGSADEITQDIYLQTQLAFLYLARNKLKPARRAAEAALVVEPRYSWARIAAAEVDLAEGKYFEAERNLLAARAYANFPTLHFTLGKLYLTVEDFDGALEQFAKAFSFSPQRQFTARLGGALEVQADNLKELLAREHQAAIFLAEPPTTPETFKIAEALVRFNVHLRIIKTPTPAPPASRNSRVEKSAAKQFGPTDADAGRKQMEELDRAAMDFIEVENVRRSFRMLHIARRLSRAGVAPGLARELADQALGLAEVATEFDGSLRDYPNYDRDGRLRIFRGRALDAKGWALFKANRNQEAIAALTEAVEAYGSLPEGKQALWHLATARETEGELKEALDVYIAGYAPPENGSDIDVNRVVIEALYRKVNGSLDGLNRRLGLADASSVARIEAANNEAKAAPKANRALVKAEPKAGQPAPKRNPEFKLSIPSAFPAKDRNNSSIETPAETKAENKAVETQPSRPALAAQTNQPPENNAPVKTAPATPKVLPPASSAAQTVLKTFEPPANFSAAPPTGLPTGPLAAPPAPPIAPRPVQLPAINNAEVSIPLRSWVGWLTISSTFKFFTVRAGNEEVSSPPAALKAHTRRRTINAPDDKPPAPKTHTRQRRVATPDNQ